MKVQWRVGCLALVLCLDIIFIRYMADAYFAAKETLFPVIRTDTSHGAGIEEQSLLGEKQIALTFDDGPHSEYTPHLLDGLRDRGVHATFFLLGENIDGKEAIVQQMKEDGHLIGNHGLTHVQMSKEPSEKACGQIEITNQKIISITGQKPQYLRPPFGSWSDELDCSTDMTVVLWDIDPLDWKLQNTSKVVRYVVKHVEPGDIVLLHDVFPTSVEAAFEIIDTLTKQGYTFVTVDELLVD